MASPTLAQSALLSQDMLQRGVIENIITVDRFYEVLPFMGISGNALAYNRELALGDVQGAAVGDTITAKAAATTTLVTSSLKTIVGDAEVNGLIAASRSNINDQIGFQIASKAKSVGRTYANYLVNGVESTSQMAGLLSLVDSSKVVTAGADGAALSFDLMDQAIDLVTDKDGQVDYFMFSGRELRSYMALLRGLGGASINEVVTLPSGAQIPAYRGIPIFRNDWLPIDQTQGSATTASTIFAGTLDDGSGMVGISGLTSEQNGGIVIEDVGIHQSRDERIYRVKMYGGLALFNLNGLSAVKGII